MAGAPTIVTITAPVSDNDEDDDHNPGGDNQVKEHVVELTTCQDLSAGAEEIKAEDMEYVDVPSDDYLIQHMEVCPEEEEGQELEQEQDVNSKKALN